MDLVKMYIEWRSKPTETSANICRHKQTFKEERDIEKKRKRLSIAVEIIGIKYGKECQRS